MLNTPAKFGELRLCPPLCLPVRAARPSRAPLAGELVQLPLRRLHPQQEGKERSIESAFLGYCILVLRYVALHTLVKKTKEERADGPASTYCGTRTGLHSTCRRAVHTADPASLDCVAMSGQKIGSQCSSQPLYPPWSMNGPS